MEPYVSNHYRVLPLVVWISWRGEWHHLAPNLQVEESSDEHPSRTKIGTQRFVLFQQARTIPRAYHQGM